jgi:hypothetical protein
MKLIVICLLIIAPLFYRGHLPMTYSHFTSKAGAEALVLETGQWVSEDELSDIIDTPTEPQTSPSSESGNATTIATEDKLAQAVSIKINGDSDIKIPSEGEVRVTYSATVKDKNGELVPDEAIKWWLLDEVEGVSFDEEAAALVVSSNASPGCVTLVAYAGSDPEVFAELVIALIEEARPEEIKSEEPEPEAVDDMEAEAEEEQEQEAKDTYNLLEDDDDVKTDGNSEDLPINEVN